MKILINYDFFEAVKNAREPLTPLKVFRDHKAMIACFHFPICMAINMRHNSIPSSLLIYGFDYLFVSGLYYLCDSFLTNSFGKDPYAKIATDRLQKLAGQLKNINVETSYDMLLKSEVYETKHKVELNQNKLPSILESKFILVPSQLNGDVHKTSILQEHVIGSNQYELSVGTPTKKMKLVAPAFR